MRNRKDELIDRAELLRALIQDLTSELTKTEAELNTLLTHRPQRLTTAFFWGEVFPVLANARDKGLVAGEIMKVLRKRGYAFSAGAFRTFLSRRGAEGLVTNETEHGSRGRWRLTEKALQMRADKEV